MKEMLLGLTVDMMNIEDNSLIFLNALSREVLKDQSSMEKSENYGKVYWQMNVQKHVWKLMDI